MEFTLDYIRRWLDASRRRYFDWALFIAFLITLFWFLSNVAAPYLAPPGTIDLGEDGVTGRISSLEDNAEQIESINNSFARAIYVAGDGNCHQHASRSFFLNENQMPFCARCSAIFLGIAIGVLVVFFLVIELSILWLIIGLVPMGLDGGIQLITQSLYKDGVIDFFYESTNAMRFLTGTIGGIAAGLALGYIISEIGHTIVMRRQLKKGPE